MIPARFASEVYAIFRIVFGLLFLMHGLQKLAGWFGGLAGDGQAVPLDTLMGVAGIIECTVGPLILFGLFTRYAAFLASGMMAAAYFIAHNSRGGLPLQNMGEPAVMNCFAFLYMAARGSGIWSLDALRSPQSVKARSAA
jgi:putative oxidoreductase